VLKEATCIGCGKQGPRASMAGGICCSDCSPYSRTPAEVLGETTLSELNEIREAHWIMRELARDGESRFFDADLMAIAGQLVTCRAAFDDFARALREIGYRETPWD